MSKAYIHLANGMSFCGQRAGASGDALGEMVFSTAMVGYMEALSDPSYYGQILMQTFPIMGNYGVIREDMESGRVHPKAYIAREICDSPSNFRAGGDLSAFLRENGVPGVTGVDTRAITRVIRAQGVMNAFITDAPTLSPEQTRALTEYRVSGAVPAVGGRETRVFTPAAKPNGLRVALIDYGAKAAVARSIIGLGCEVVQLPYHATAKEVLATEPDGILLSNGPGDPADNPACVDTIRDLLGQKPIMGICLGHQLLALAAGGRTEKMKFGHRGANKPVVDLKTGHVYITSQNHGYAVVSGSIPAGAGSVRFIEADDQTVEGVDYPRYRAFSVQFHPEACAGPRDAGVLFEQFITMMKEG